MRIEVRPDRQAYDDLQPEYRNQLIGSRDDMWASFADSAEAHALIVDGEVVGCFSVDDDKQLHGFTVRGVSRLDGAELLAHVVDVMVIDAAMPATVDPQFLAWSLAVGGDAECVALMYEHVDSTVIGGEAVLRLAGPADLEAAVAFDHAATGGAGDPDSFLVPFLAERIERQELHLLEVDGTIIATGECRRDERAPGHAHLGVIVGPDHRRHGLGTSVLVALTTISRSLDLVPVCSTAPSNVAAQRAIENAGFRSRHRVFRVPMTR